MKRSIPVSAGRVLRAAPAVAMIVLSLFLGSPVRADDGIGLIMSTAPSGEAATSVSMRIAPEAAEAIVPIFIRKESGSTLFGVTFSATPLRGGDGTVTTVTPAFDRDKRTITGDGEMRRLELSVTGLRALGTFTSTLYAKHGTGMQTLGTLTVDHTLPAGELEIARIDRSRATRSFPGVAARPAVLVTIRNRSDRDLTVAGLAIERLLVGGSSSTARPTLRMTDESGAAKRAGFVIPAGASTTVRVVLDGVRNTGRYEGVLRVSAERAIPATQRFGFDVKQGPLYPALLIAAGVAVSYGLRRRLSNGPIARAGLQRVVERLLVDARAARAGAGTLERQEALAIESMERRLIDVSDSLAQGRARSSRATLTEIDRKLDCFGALITARTLVRAVKPGEITEPFDTQLAQAFAFLAETTPADGLEPRLAEAERTAAGMPAGLEAVVRERFHADVDRMTSAAEHSPAVSAALEVRVFERIDGAKRLADEGRFADAHAALGAAQLAFAHALADDFLARLPDPDEPPPGFSTGWPRFRGSIAEALRGVRRQRRGPSAADAYRKVWREYAIELAGRLKTAAARERRGSSESRREQLAAVVEACEEASDLSETFDPAALDAYRRAVDGSFGRARRSPGRVRAALEDAGLPYPLTVVATGLKDAGPIERLSPGPLVSAGAVTAQIRRRRFGVALAAGVVSIPAGLALLWAPTDTWGTFTDSVAILGWGFGVHAVAAVADAQRLGWIAARAARSARRATPGDVALQPGSLIPQREPSN